MCKIITINVNGIRSSAKKGLFEWLAMQQADVICLQETKAQEHQLHDDAFHLPGYQRYFHDAKKAGYSGVAIFTKHRPLLVKAGLGWPEADDEGRYLQVDYANVSIASVYFPSGTSGESRQAVKFDFLKRFSQCLDVMNVQGRRFIFCGDFNIAHQPIDLKNWRNNQKNSGFLPEERAWLDDFIENKGMIDCFRKLHPEEVAYSWWSTRSHARARNVGWRIDYQFASPLLKDELMHARIDQEHVFSDHAPVIVEYRFML